MDPVVARFHDLADRWRGDGDAATCEALAADLAARLATIPSPRAVARTTRSDAEALLALRPLLQSYGVALTAEGAADDVRFLLLARDAPTPNFPPSIVRRRTVPNRGGAHAAPIAASAALPAVTLVPRPADGALDPPTGAGDPDPGAWQPAGEALAGVLRRLTGRTRIG